MVNKPVISIDIRKMPFVVVLFFYCLGILAGRYFNLLIPSLLYVLIIILVMAFLLLISLCFSKHSVFKTISFVVLYASFSVFGFYGAIKKKPHLQKNYFSNYKAEQLIGIVSDEPVVKEKSIRFPMELAIAIDSVASNKVTGKVMVTVLKDSLQSIKIDYGDKLIFKNKVAEVKSAFNPIRFDYQNYLANKNCWHQALLTSKDYLIISHKSGNPIIDFSLGLRKNLVDKFSEYIPNERSFQIASALIFGFRSSVDQETLASFTKTGTIHILSVSGFHVVLVFFILTLLLKWMDQFKNGKAIRLCLVFIAIWSYVILTGMAPSILRSGVMISFHLFGLWVNRKQSVFNSLAASAFFLLLFDAKMLFDIGFQLSYLSILGMSAFLPLFHLFYQSKNKLINWILDVIYVSIAVQLATLPFVLYYFGQFPTYFLVANLFIAIPAMLIMYIGILLAGASFISYISKFVGAVLSEVIDYTYRGLEQIARLPKASVAGFYINEVQVLFLALSLLFLFIAWNYRSKLMLKLCLFQFIFFLVAFQVQRFQQFKFNGVKFYNVNQHIAIARIHQNKVILLSSLDSLRHSTLQFAVLPDLLRYSDEEDIEFRRLSSNSTFQLDFDSTLNSNFVLWRKNKNQDFLEAINSYKNYMILLDGSNSDRSIAKHTKILNENQLPFYILKNNYAYVYNTANKE
ncbi:ComEC/Rec2 family competence protein [Sphingobacterium hungaricum]|uniref:Competence protein ComEC n=1 Tax=Sphingobacterium hungaricum TaxID=2082723 RepID=A0A928V2Q7_9SPHI|nr:ComEC/Rec2 family competence protein [Sphingobacterium hungaricum]MBE8715457.1 hypothetical protein [Sphingobacterium hungaricum]